MDNVDKYFNTDNSLKASCKNLDDIKDLISYIRQNDLYVIYAYQKRHMCPDELHCDINPDVCSISSKVYCCLITDVYEYRVSRFQVSNVVVNVSCDNDDILVMSVTGKIVDDNSTIKKNSLLNKITIYRTYESAKSVADKRNSLITDLREY